MSALDKEQPVLKKGGEECKVIGIILMATLIASGWGEGLRLMKEVNLMMTKKLIVLLVAMAFALGVVGVSLSAAQEIKGTVAKIEGDKVTIQDAAGKQTTVSVNDPTMLQDLKVGDRVSIKDGKLTKEKI